MRDKKPETQALAPKERAQDIFHKLCTFMSARETSTVSIIEALHALKDHDLYRALFPTWEDCVEDAGLGLRKAEYLLNIRKACVEAGLDVQRALTRAGGWTTLALVAPKLTKKNAPSLLDKVGRMSVRDVEKFIKGEPTPDDEGQFTFSAKLTASQKQVVDRARAKFEETCTGERSSGFFLEMLSAEFLGGK